MPRLEDHLGAAQINRELAFDLTTQPRGISWAPVVGFYAALHLVDAFLASGGIHPATHVIRRAVMRESRELQILLEDYRTLEALSRESRYELRRFSETDARELLDGELGRISKAIHDLLDQAGS